MPSIHLPERASDQRCQDDGAVDEQIIDLKRVRAPQVAGRVEGAHLAGEIPLEAADSGQQAKERDQERGVEGHQEMAGGHQERADGDRAGPSEPPVGDEAAGDRGQVHEAGVEPEDRRGESHVRKRAAVDALDGGAERGEPGDALDVPGKQHLANHVQHEKRLHAVIGEPLPCFREGEIGESARMAQKGMVSVSCRANSLRNRAQAARINNECRLGKKPALPMEGGRGRLLKFKKTGIRRPSSWATLPRGSRADESGGSRRPADLRP